jgi:MoaA/NifB/PqqE/SkfB family radical SAM enzyme
MRPEEVVAKVAEVRSSLPQLTVVAVAGPGEPLANEQTLESLRLLRRAYPELILCLSTNGLLLPERVPQILQLGVGHVTVTVNAVEPSVGEKIYSWVHYEGKTYWGREASSLLLSKQEEGVRKLAEEGILVKVNSVMIPEVNSSHLPQVAEQVKKWGAFMMNVMPLIPVEGTDFQGLRKPSLVELKRLRDQCEVHIKQMRHCRQCRSDAVGFLGNNLTVELVERREKKPWELSPAGGIKVAVATKSGRLVDQHFGHADSFLIYRASLQSTEFLEKRNVGQYCFGKSFCGDKEESLLRTVELLKDCQAVLCLRIGYGPKQYLREAGIEPVETYDLVEDAVAKVAARRLAA